MNKFLIIAVFTVFATVNFANAQKKKPENNVVNPTVNINNKVIKIEQLKQLIPIDIVEPKSKNIYKKFGLDLSGNCYACDLAKLSITEKTIKLTNVCDEQQNQVLEIVEITNTENRINIKTKQLNFIFNQIDKAPIYELKIIGNKAKYQNLRISKYYTLKKLLKKFKQHDCGDFQG
ncbi:hypothetical protein [Pedobacter nototheniae]|uniref:hypothetical protein n=1 Tax=Pedobacter nototheniae TaxID=2488994 RepID=UPI00292D48E7|nr:hypothetical protein [Pedobacter nototheniae]